MAASYAGCDEVLVVTLLTISIAGQGFNAAGTTLNMFDLGPNYIGPLTGVVNSVSTLASMLAPAIVGYLTPHVNQTLFLHLKVSIFLLLSIKIRHIYRNGVLCFGLHVDYTFQKPSFLPFGAQQKFNLGIHMKKWRRTHDSSSRNETVFSIIFREMFDTIDPDTMRFIGINVVQIAVHYIIISIRMQIKIK